jgi:hypothetical protein
MDGLGRTPPYASSAQYIGHYEPYMLVEGRAGVLIEEHFCQ